MLINDMFLTLQGEGETSGLLTFFIRTARCNMSCSWCDTQFKEPAKEMMVAQIVGDVGRAGTKHVCITGGEPLLEKDFFVLEDWLINAGYDAIVETNGSMDIQKVRCRVAMDVKPPSSKMDSLFRKENLKYIKPNDQIKFIIADEKDYEYAKVILKDVKQGIPIFMPVWNSRHVIARRLAKWIIRDKLTVRLSLQVNKILRLK